MNKRQLAAIIGALLVLPVTVGLVSLVSFSTARNILLGAGLSLVAGALFVLGWLVLAFRTRGSHSPRETHLPHTPIVRTRGRHGKTAG